MPSLLLQFFALPEETLALLKESFVASVSWKTVMKHGPDLVVETFPPGEDWLSASSRPDRVCLTSKQPHLPVASPYEFLVKNPDSLVIDLGKLATDSLSESGLSARTEDSETYKEWQRIAKALKAATKVGLWVKNPETGAKSFSKNLRYTEGAHSFSLQGGRLKPIAGWNLLSVEEPD